MAKNNPRYECKGCSHKVTRNQLKANNGVCIYCKTPMHHTAWLGGQAVSLAQLIGLSKSDEADLKALADGAGVDFTVLVRTAVQDRLRNWLTDPSKAVELARQDIMLAKLYQR